MATDRLNWGYEKSWPPATPEYVFAAKALDAMGALHFGTAWTGTELQTQQSVHNPPRIPADFDTASQLSRDTAKSLIRMYCPEIETPKTVSEEHWSLALDAVERDRAARSRFREAKEVFREHCAWGRLVAAYMLSSGEAIKVEKERWNNREQAMKWLLDCSVPSNYGHARHPLFVRMDTLTALVNPLGTSPSATEPAKGYRSKYLRLLLAAADSLNVKPDDNRTRKQVANDILTFARGVADTDISQISPTMADNMATILREPEAGGGKNSPRYKNK
ncbi:hypothetical protein [Mesorhizobium sp.]|uniref:hypothetical protein n=1 Tax=Mesorhizobium sp. TaxID=1871066 RepID=UPI000FE81E51|nr:hypothetical protein [Mesorhizobium sp.]RWO57822.1 MAG: hypothetical protein EOS14_22440 [Mesorhizobium sp.]